MKPRTIEKQLYKVAALLVIVGTIECIINLSGSHLGLYLVLAGHLVGVTAIFMNMKYTNDLERKQQALKEGQKQLSNH